MSGRLEDARGHGEQGDGIQEVTSGDRAIRVSSANCAQQLSSGEVGGHDRRIFAVEPCAKPLGLGLGDDEFDQSGRVRVVRHGSVALVVAHGSEHIAQRPPGGRCRKFAERSAGRARVSRCEKLRKRRRRDRRDPSNGSTPVCDRHRLSGGRTRHDGRSVLLEGPDPDFTHVLHCRTLARPWTVCASHHCRTSRVRSRHGDRSRSDQP